MLGVCICSDPNQKVRDADDHLSKIASTIPCDELVELAPLEAALGVKKAMNSPSTHLLVRLFFCDNSKIAGSETYVFHIVTIYRDHPSYGKPV